MWWLRPHSLDVSASSGFSFGARGHHYERSGEDTLGFPFRPEESVTATQGIKGCRRQGVAPGALEDNWLPTLAPVTLV